jgi:hypothetical protein
MYTVIFFGSNDSVGQEVFSNLIEARDFDDYLLDQGYTTSGVLGDPCLD